MAPTFSVVAEGPSDFEVLRHVLAGHFSDPDIVVNLLQPAVDDTSGHNSPGGWYEVFRFLGSERFAGAFARSDYVVVHIDTDVCEESYFGVSRREADGRERTGEEVLGATIERLVREMGAAYAVFRERIIFAVAVESVECWLLPLYYSDGRREKLVNCLGSLNAALSAREGFSIDAQMKQVKYYFKVARRLAKRKELAACWPHNPGFKAFVGALADITP
jgi:hypothetical protein